MCDSAGLGGATDHVLLPISHHAADTLIRLARRTPNSQIQISPFCYEPPTTASEVQEVKGWSLDVPVEASANSLPIGTSMFDGMSIVQCMMSEEEILNVLMQSSSFRTRMGQAVKRIRHRTEKNPEQRATWARCQPAGTGYPASLIEGCRNKTGAVIFEPAPCSVPILDSEDWIPELSDNGFVGMFHHWFDSAHDHRLCLYVACRSYLPAACLEFTDVVNDMGTRCTAATVVSSEEAHWLRRANTRNRCRILAEVCREMNLNIQTTNDHNAHDPHHVSVAVPDVETMHNDLYLLDKSVIRVVNAVAETSMASNGIACALAPWQGIVIFHGVGGAQVVGDFGTAYGRQFIPTQLPRVIVDDLQQKVLPKQFAFTSCDAIHSRPLQVWGFVASQVAVYNEPELVLDLVEKAHVTEQHTMLDPDILLVYQKLIAQGTSGNLILLPNLPGLVPSSSTSSHQTFHRFDEAVLCGLATNGWERRRGFTILVPVAIALASMCSSVADSEAMDEANDILLD